MASGANDQFLLHSSATQVGFEIAWLNIHLKGSVQQCRLSMFRRIVLQSAK